MRSLKDLIEQLPPELQEEVRDFIEFLLERKARRPKAGKKGELKLDWRGALCDLRDKYTSVELQHKVLKWWDFFDRTERGRKIPKDLLSGRGI